MQRKLLDLGFKTWAVGAVPCFAILLTANTVNGFRDHPANGGRSQLEEIKKSSPVVGAGLALYHTTALIVFSGMKASAYATVWPLTILEARYHHKRDGHYRHLLFPVYSVSKMHDGEERARRDANRAL